MKKFYGSSFFDKICYLALAKMKFGIKVFEVDSPEKIYDAWNYRFFTNIYFLSVDLQFQK